MGDAIQFQNGAQYEAMMGVWSALVGTEFLDWLAVPDGARWADVGCGNGASTALVVAKTRPALVEAIDPSEAQLSFARERGLGAVANFTEGSALELPYADAAFDAAIMALVLFFVPEPARGVAELARVVRPGGTVAAYAWDIEGGGFPYEDLHSALREVGAQALQPPHAEVAALTVLERLWREVGLVDVETRVITAQRTFDSFEHYWSIATSAPGISPVLAKLDLAQQAHVRRAAEERRQAKGLTVDARAHAVRGRVPAS